MSWSKERLRQRLHQFHSTEHAWSKLDGTALSSNRKAAVLIPLVIKAGVLHVWLTLRALTLKNDGGDVAFPGGMKDPEDADEKATCLREAEEEIGLGPRQVEVIAFLPPTVNRRQILIAPVVGIVDEDFEPTLNPHEVDAAFLLPLERFLSSTDHNTHKFTNRGIEWVTHMFQDNVGARLFRTWGLTANMCVSLAIALFQREPEFEWDKNEPNTVQDPYALQKEYMKRYILDKDWDKSKL